MSETRADHWYPTGAEYGYYEMPAVGTLIAYAHRAIRVLAHHPRHDGTTVLHVRREHGPPIDGENDRQEGGLGVAGRRTWCVYPGGRVPLCSCCGHPWPCRTMEDERRAMEAMRRDANLIARANDGCCLSCGEPVTTRQQRILAPEPNVMIPGFTAPLFHLRWSCRGFLDEYDRARRRKLGQDWAPLIRQEDELPDGAALIADEADW